MNFICCLHSCNYFVSLRISNPNWGFEEIAVMWFLLRFLLIFFYANHILIRFLLFWIIFIEDIFEWFLCSFCSTCKFELHVTALILRWTDAWLWNVFCCRYFYNGIFTLVLYFEAQCLVENFNEWKFTGVTLWCKLFWWDFDI